MDALEVKQLTVNYEKTAVLWDLNFSVPPEKIVGILGPNGAGKSTLLKALLGLVKPLGGQILFFGQPLGRLRTKIGYVPQRSSVDWDFPITAFDLVMMGRYGKMGWLKWASKEDRKAAKQALEKVDMLPFAHRQIGELSGGQQQRLFIARALVQDADLYLFDEPFSGIDMTTEMALIRIFHDLRDRGKTLLVVHHDLATVENYFDWLIMINTCLISTGPTQEVLIPQNILRTYGRSSVLLDEAATQANHQLSGLK